MSTPLDFKTIRSWDGSQDRAFEELCYQLRDPTPPRAELVKTGDPDGGLEWYFRLGNGVEWGWQAKYSFDTQTLLKLMEASLKTVVAKRPACRRLTFCIPYDLPDAPCGNERTSARDKFEARKKSWRKRIPGADRVQIELWPAGELLERLNKNPGQRGMSWFFWDKEVFSQDWLRKRLDVTVKAAGERYSPELHVNLPVAFALEGLAGSDLFWDRYRERRGAVARAIRPLEGRGHAGLGVTAQLRDLRRLARRWPDAVPEFVAPPDRLPVAALGDLTNLLREAADLAYPPHVPERGEQKSKRETKLSEKRRSLQHYLSQLTIALHEFSSFLRSGAGEAAAKGALFLTGEAGQGKTHLLCDVGERSVAHDRPAAVLLGGRLSGRRFWSDCAEYLNLPQIGGDVLLDGMRAAAAASGAPFLLLVDALNEAAEPAAWRDELPALLAELDGDPWMSIGLSVRTTFLPVVLPPGGLGDAVAEINHPGFQGRELEATERFFDAYGLEQPRVPLLTPEFTNPLFLKLYCEGLRGLGLAAPPPGEAHISDVFDRYLKWKAERITASLALDPSANTVEQAINAFSDALAEAGLEHLPRAEADSLINGFAPALHAWPNTLFGQMLNEGLVVADVAWDSGARDYVDVVRFAYQRFADYRIVGSLLDGYSSEKKLRAALAPNQPLRQKVRDAPAGWTEALAVLVPERFGVELIDLASWRLKRYRKERWQRALVRSTVSRRPEAMSERARELLSEAERTSQDLADEVLEALLTVAPIPGHPLNADHIHRVLMKRTMPARDESWGIRTYFAFGDEGPLDRLIRWASRGPYPECPDDVLLLAGTMLTWMLASPNRRMRDYTTKSLRRLLAPRLSVLDGLAEKFADVDDPYITERLAVISHGCLLTAGRSDPAAAVGLARRIRDSWLRHETSPNLLTRDAIRGCFEWALRAGLIEQAEYDDVLPPYGAAPPDKPRTKKQLEKAYERRSRKGDYLPTPYSRFFFSLFDHGDFGRYVVESHVDRFTKFPLAKPVPKARRSRPLKPDQAKLEAFFASLSAEQQGQSDIEALATGLNDEQLLELLSILNPPMPSRQSERLNAKYPAELAQRWIFERVISLGWTPERFASFEETYLRESVGRSGHKSERFGKKYQWIGLRELVARLADNFHMTAEWSDEPRSYEGPWQFYGRDIDPTLPPASRYRDDEDDYVRVGSTFSMESAGVWWDPGGPVYRRSDPLPPAGWAVDVADIPDFKTLVRRTDPSGDRWTVLQGYFKWNEDRGEDEEPRSRPRRDMWSHVYSWLVRPADLRGLVVYLRTHSFMGRWMPEAGDVTNDAYLAEMPWAAAAWEYPREWREVQARGRSEAAACEVYPAWEGYTWEGGGWDCSIEESVHAVLPAPLLFDQGQLTWQPETLNWCNPSGTVVARWVRVPDGHSVLLVRESWLQETLRGGGWSLLVGWLGEKQLFSSGWSPGLVGNWTEMNGVATMDGGNWTFEPLRIEQVSQRGA